MEETLYSNATRQTQANTSISLPPQEAKLDCTEGASTAYTPAAWFSLRDQVENIIRTIITNQQKFIEANEKEKRDKNVIIMGLEESEVNSEAMVKELISTRLELKDIGVVSKRRLGKSSISRQTPRPALVVLESVEHKVQIMKSRTKLCGSNIFINNDLTPEQRKIERDPRRKKLFLIK